MEGYLGTLSYQAKLLSRSLPATRADYGGGLRGTVLACGAKLTRRAARRAANGHASHDIRNKLVASGLPKNYQVVAVKPDTV